MEDARGIDLARWTPLIDFVGRWHRDPIASRDTIDPRWKKSGPRALREWFSLVGDRIDGRGFFSFPEAEFFARWPRLGSKKASLHESDVERGLIPVVRVGGHGGWGIHREDPDEDPRVHQLELEGQPSQAFSGPLSALLTNAAIWETFQPRRDPSGPLGPLAATVRRTTLDGSSAAQEFLRRPLFRPVPGWTLEGGEVLADPEKDTLVLNRHVLTRTEALGAAVQGLLRKDGGASTFEQRELERRYRDDERARALAGRVPPKGS